MFDRLEKSATRIVGMVDRSVKVESVYDIIHQDDALDTEAQPKVIDSREDGVSKYHTARQDSVQSLNVGLESN